jgi:hypothetical protein
MHIYKIRARLLVLLYFNFRTLSSHCSVEPIDITLHAGLRRQHYLISQIYLRSLIVWEARSLRGCVCTSRAVPWICVRRIIQVIQ